MAVSPGTRLGVFEVVATLGVGGMGEVYRATDSRLKRDVAIKILPESLANDLERLGRFQREAELLASLNHPNIAAVFGIEDSGAGKALVMELIEGVDLREALSRGALPVDETLAIARQLAAAIRAAHDRGIVHRDLKPANIRIRPDGTLKVLDFGLAKAVAGDGRTDEATRTATELGKVMGTPRYMSPEQARGDAAGPQADIWAFGVILYEMLTGKAAFDAPSSIQVLARVLNDEPDFTVLPSTVPPRIKLLLQRCLRKDSQRRLHHIGDAAIEIEEATSAVGAIETQVPPRRQILPAVVAAATVAALIGSAAAGWLRTERTTRPALVRSDVVLPDALDLAPLGARRVAISPDGSRIAVASGAALRVRRLEDAEFTVVSTRATNPFFSPDGQWIAYFGGGFNATVGLWKVPAGGGAPVLIAATSDRTLGGDWRADGTIVFATTSGLFMVREDGSQLRSVTRADGSAGQRLFAWPQFLPEVNAVQFTIVPNGSISGAQIAIVDLATSKVEAVVNGGSAARYLPGGHLVYASGQQLKRAAFDPRRPQARGPEMVIDGIRIGVAQDSGAADFAVSDSGILLFHDSPGALAAVLTRVSWVDRQGREEPIDLPTGRYGYPRVSPDGSRIALDVQGNNRDIWLYDLERRALSQLSFGPTEDLLPVWSRDGSRVFWGSDRAGSFDVYSRAADGATPERLEFGTKTSEMPISFSPEGTRLFVSENFRDIVMVTGPPYDKTEMFLPATSATERRRLPEVSPDGKWIAYESVETGPGEVFIRPFPDSESRRVQVSRAGGNHPFWNPAGNGELFYVTHEGHMMAATISFGASISIREQKLFDGPRPPATGSARLYDVSRKDGRFVITRRVQTDQPSGTRLTLIVNWASAFHE